MELRHVAERRLPVLLRSSPAHQHGKSSSFLASQRSTSHSSRSFSASSMSKADGESSSSPTQAPSASSSDTSKNTSNSDSSTSAEGLDDLLSSRLNFARGNQPASRSPPLNRNPNTAQQKPREQAASVRELLQQIKENAGSPPGIPAVDRDFLPGRTGNALGLQSWNRRSNDGGLNPLRGQPDDSTQTIAAMLRSMPGGDLAKANESAMAAPPLRLNASLGRTVKVDTGRNMDLGRAFRQLDATIARNRVRSDANRQRFHERPGLKRKRLRSERWRRRFKEGFQDVVRRVEELRRQGW